MWVAEVLKDDCEFFGPFVRSQILRLIKYVKMTWRARPSCSKEAVKRRDGRCAYCTKGSYPDCTNAEGFGWWALRESLTGRKPEWILPV